MDFTDLKDFMDRLTAWRIPGNSISLCMDGKEIFSYSSGYADMENKIPMSPDKLVNIYSCSKVATVVGALQLYEKGYFLLDDPIYEFIPEYKYVTVKEENGEIRKAKRPITMRNLFTMTSGLTYNSRTPGFDKAREITQGRMDTLTVAKCMASDPLVFDPGDRWLYSLSHDVLAAIVEVISGKKFRDYMKENIFDPLGMNETFYHNEGVRDKMAEQYNFRVSDETDIVKLQMSVHEADGGYHENVGKGVGLVYGSEYDSGGAGITTSINDYSKFCAALARFGLGANGERILSKGTVELLRTNQLSPERLKEYRWGQVMGYGYGLGVRTMNDKALSGSNGSYGEFGWGGAAGATVLADPETGLSYFYAHHMHNPQEPYYQPRLRNVVYNCLTR